jgi:hypothetical protein
LYSSAFVSTVDQLDPAFIQEVNTMAGKPQIVDGALLSGDEPGLFWMVVDHMDAHWNTDAARVQSGVAHFADRLLHEIKNAVNRTKLSHYVARLVVRLYRQSNGELRCQYCQRVLVLKKGGGAREYWACLSLDRLWNRYGHTAANMTTSCRHCNCTKGAHSSPALTFLRHHAYGDDYADANLVFPTRALSLVEMTASRPKKILFAEEGEEPVLFQVPPSDRWW